MTEEINISRSVDQLINDRANALAFGVLATLADWSGGAPHEHVVQFYESDTYLLDSLGGFISTGLGEADLCIVVATKTHRDGLEERLRHYGRDTAAAALSGQYIALDASDTLSQLMVDGRPDAARFAEVIGSVIGRAAKVGQRVRVFGEMVALLWEQGNTDAALDLEGLWNELHKSHSFSLFCAYPINGFDHESFAKGLDDICGKHARVIPAESFTALTSSHDRLRSIIQLQQKSRLLEAEIAERKQAAELLRISLEHERMARTEAEEANRLKDEFLATVSHELRTPLNAIIGWSYMIRSKTLDEATLTRAIETIERNAKSQAQLIEDILDVSRVITGKLSLDTERVDVVTVINAAIDSVQLAADSKDIQLEVTLKSSSRHVVGDATRLQQIVWNLLSNAIKFTPPGGRVGVRLDRLGPNAQITVSDTGEGIDTAFLPFIFDRFRQADGASTRRHGGLGLGLAIVRHLVELHGGTVHVDSTGIGHGATFTIILPLANGGDTGSLNTNLPTKLLASKEESLRDISRVSLVDVRVLVVDNDQDSVNMLAEILTDSGAAARTATSVAEALDAISCFKPDVLVSDLAMPDEDGFALIARVRSLAKSGGKEIPAVALTAYVRVDDRARALSAGFNMFVPKPVVPNELITAISTLAGIDSDQMVLPNTHIL